MNSTSTPTKSYRTSRRLLWLALFMIVVIGLTIVITPIWLIQPFQPQTPRALEVSYVMRRMSPIVTIIASIAVLLVVVWLWRKSRWFGKAFAVLVTLPLFAATWMARQNHFEWMFRPDVNISYAPPDTVNYINDDDMVLSVTRSGEAVAYPVRLMAYHHLVQDVVGGTPIVATY
ncbi:MAG: hypothetical protein C5B55_03880 [Blastocatellia bacterium]|nr:MAG: hypothetical protein C5B55_03880 [Blastocatellia bacterium]